MADLIYNLQSMINGAESTNVGFEYYQGGQVNDHSNRTPVGVFTMFTDTISTVTQSSQQFALLDTGALKLQLFAEGQRQGQRPGARETETIVLHGAPTALGGPVPNPPNPGNPAAQPAQARPVLRAFGSVSAATQMWADRIGHQWSYENGVLTIH